MSEDDPEFVEALLAAGNNATFEGRCAEAETLLLRALDASGKIHGEKSSQTLFALTRVCIVSRLLKKVDQAESTIQKALAIAGECFPDDRLFPWTLENFALLREAESKIGEATEAYERTVAEYERISAFRHIKQPRLSTTRVDSFCELRISEQRRKPSGEPSRS